MMLKEIGFIGLANTVQQIYALVLSQGYGSKGHTSIAHMIEEWARVKMEG